MTAADATFYNILKAWREWPGPAFPGTGINKQPVEMLTEKVNGDIFNIRINVGVLCLPCIKQAVRAICC